MADAGRDLPPLEAFATELAGAVGGRPVRALATGAWPTLAERAS